MGERDPDLPCRQGNSNSQNREVEDRVARTSGDVSQPFMSQSSNVARILTTCKKCVFINLLLQPTRGLKQPHGTAHHHLATLRERELHQRNATIVGAEGETIWELLRFLLPRPLGVFALHRFTFLLEEAGSTQTQPPTVVCKNGSSVGIHTHLYVWRRFARSVCAYQQNSASELIRKFSKSVLLVGEQFFQIFNEGNTL